MKEGTENPNDTTIGPRIQKIHNRLNDIESHSAPARAAVILNGIFL